MFKISFKCSSCKTKLSLKVQENTYNTKQHVRCSSCQNINSVNVPSEEKFKANKASKKQEQAAQTVIGTDFSKSKTFTLSVLDQNQRPSQIFVVEKPEIIIGRKNKAGEAYKSDFEIGINDGYMSKKHALLKKKASNAYVISDLNSTNGTFLNGEKLKENETVFIEHNDMLKLGNTFLKISIK